MSNRCFDASTLTKLISDRAQAEHVRLKQKLMASPNPPKNFLRWNSNTNDKDASVIGDITNGWGTTWSKGSPLMVPDVPCGCVEVIVPYVPPVPISTTHGVAEWAIDAGIAYPGPVSVCGSLSSATDASGNIYVVGFYTSPMNIYNYSMTRDGIIEETIYGWVTTFSDAGDLFLIKYSSTGIVQWATTINAEPEDIPILSNLTDAGTHLAIDTNGNPTVTFIAPISTFSAQLIHVNNAGAPYPSPCYYTPDPLSPCYNRGLLYQPFYGFVKIPASSVNSFVLVQYNGTDGSVRWATNAEAGLPYSIACDPLNHLIVCGYSLSDIPLRSATGTTAYLPPDYDYPIVITTPYATLSGGSTKTGFLIQYDTSGIIQWATNQVSNPGRDILPYHLVTDQRANIYLIGSFTNNIQFNSFLDLSGSMVHTSSFGTLRGAESTDIFLAKYRINGLCDWVTGLLGAAGSTNRGFAITIDASSHLCITGSFNSYPLLLNDVSSTTFQTVHLTPFANLYSYSGSYANSAIFLATYTTAGHAIWATSMIGQSMVASASATSIVTDHSNNIYLACTYDTPLILASYSGLYNSIIQTKPYGILSTITGSTAIIAYSPRGIVLWAASQDGTQPLAHGIAIDPAQKLILVGERGTQPLTIQNFVQVQTALPSTIQETPFGTLAASGEVYGFLAKYST